VLINVNFPETRGTALAYLKFGRCLGPGIIALLIQSGWERVEAFTMVRACLRSDPSRPLSVQ